MAISIPRPELTAEASGWGHWAQGPEACSLCDQLQEISNSVQMYDRVILLEPGDYTLDGVARDSISGKAAVVHGAFEIPPIASAGIGMSRVVLSRGVNPLTEAEEGDGASAVSGRQAYFVPNVNQ